MKRERKNHTDDWWSRRETGTGYMWDYVIYLFIDIHFKNLGAIHSDQWENHFWSNMKLIRFSCERECGTATTFRNMPRCCESKTSYEYRSMRSKRNVFGNTYTSNPLQNADKIRRDKSQQNKFSIDAWRKCISFNARHPHTIHTQPQWNFKCLH